MPERTPEERELIDSLPVKKADEKCNARTPRGYCKNVAGYGTDHVGKGRCKFHGGSSKGAPIITGLYSEKMKSTLREEYEKLANDPNLVEMTSEFAVYKGLVGNFITRIRETLDDPSQDFWTQINDKGNREVSAHSKALMTLLENMSRLFQRIVDAERKSQEHLDLKDIYNYVTQIRNIMDDTCSVCPVRSGVGEKLTKIKIRHK